MSISGSYLPNIVTSLVGKWEGHIEAGSQRLKYALEVQDISEQQKGHITYKGTHESGNRTGVSVTVEWDCMTEVVIRDAEALIEGKLDVLRGTMEGAVRAQATMEVFGKFHLQLIPSNGSNNVMAHVPAMQTSTARISESVRMSNATASHLRASVSTPRGSMSASRNRVSHGNREGGEILYTIRGSKTYASASEQERVTSREAARRKFFDAERKYVASSARTTKLLHSRISNATGRPIRESSGRPPSIAPQSSTPRKFNQDPRGGSVTSAVPSHLMTPRGRSATPSTTRAAVHHRNTIETHYQLRSTTERFQTPKKHEPESALREWVDPRDIAARAAPRNSPAKTSFGGTTPRFFSPGAARAAAMGSSRPDTNNPARYEFVDPRDIAYSLKPINQRVVALPHRSSTRPGILSTGCL